MNGFHFNLYLLIVSGSFRVLNHGKKKFLEKNSCNTGKSLLKIIIFIETKNHLFIILWLIFHQISVVYGDLYACRRDVILGGRKRRSNPSPPCFCNTVTHVRYSKESPGIYLNGTNVEGKYASKLYLCFKKHWLVNLSS